MTKPYGYSVASYGDMVTDEPRMSAYASALKRAVFPGCTVIDIGAGPGIFSLLACQFGAGRVFAIEPNDSIELLRIFAKDNGFADRITIVPDISTNFVADTRADVIVSDLRGILPLFEHHIETIRDARERLLKPGGVLIPGRDRLRMALASHPKARASIDEPWLSNSYGLNLNAGHQYTMNAYRKANLSPESLFSYPVELGELDYYSLFDSKLDREVTLRANRAGSVDGLLLWFDSDLHDGIGFSNAPGKPKLIYGQTFLPFAHSCEITEGDPVEARFSAVPVDGDYVFSWSGQIIRKSSDAIKFRHSSFGSRVRSPRTLALTSEHRVPPLRNDIAIDELILSLVDGERSQGDIARAVLDRFPEQSKGYVDALARVAGLMQRYND